MSIAYAMRLGLGPTNPGMITIAQETLLFRPTGFSPVLKLLIPAFSLPNAPSVPYSLTSPLIGTLLYHVPASYPTNTLSEDFDASPAGWLCQL